VGGTQKLTVTIAWRSHCDVLLAVFTFHGENVLQTQLCKVTTTHVCGGKTLNMQTAASREFSRVRRCPISDPNLEKKFCFVLPPNNHIVPRDKSSFSNLCFVIWEPWSFLIRRLCIRPLHHTLHHGFTMYNRYSWRGGSDADSNPRCNNSKQDHQKENTISSNKNM
jgi:hypothetical protein